MDRVDKIGILDLDSVIFLDDFNLSPEPFEVWGVHSRLDSMRSHIKDLFFHKSFIEINPDLIGPTWKNGHWGSHGISKRLDQFFVKEGFSSRLSELISWILPSLILSHFPIFMNWSSIILGKEASLKFNHF